MNSDQTAKSPDDNDAYYYAADWRVRHDTGLSEKEELEFAAWLTSDPDHHLAWREVNTTATLFEQLREKENISDTLEKLDQRRHQRTKRRRLRIVGIVGLAALIAVLVSVQISTDANEIASTPTLPSQTTTPVQVARVRTAPSIISKPQQRQLPDGSQIILKENAAISINYTKKDREVMLLSGEAFFTVEKDITRPFIVVSGQTRVQAVGTAFAVRTSEESMNVLVTEGEVSVGTSHAPVYVKAREELVVPSINPADRILQPRQLADKEIDRQLDWRRPRLILTRTTLRDAVTALNAENSIQITISSSSIAQMSLTGVFFADDVASFVRLLGAHYGVETEQRGQNEFVLLSN